MGTVANPRQETIALLERDLTKFTEQIDRLTEEPIDTKKIAGMLKLRGPLGDLLEEARRVRATGLPGKIREQQDRIQKVLVG